MTTPVPNPGAPHFEIDRQGLVIAGVRFDQPQTLAWFTNVLGTVDVRTEVPEIAKRRPDLSNKLHVFDSLGIVLNEHHAHKLVFSVTFAFVPEDVSFPPARPLAGDLVVFGARLRGRETEREVAEYGVHPDRAFVHLWDWDLGVFSVGFDFHKLRNPISKKRMGVHRLVAVDYGIFTPEHAALRRRDRERDIPE